MGVGMRPSRSLVVTDGAAARRRALNSAATEPPANCAAIHSPAEGILNSAFALAKIGDVGMASGAEASTWVSCDIVSSWRLVSGWGSVDSSSTSGSGSEAAMESIIASANAGTATTESSWSKADETIMTPFLSYLNFLGTAPTLTES